MEKEIVKDKIPKVKKPKEVKKVKVKIYHPFRWNKKLRDSSTKTLPVAVANWMVDKRYGKIL